VLVQIVDFVKSQKFTNFKIFYKDVVALITKFYFTNFFVDFFILSMILKMIKIYVIIHFGRLEYSIPGMLLSEWNFHGN
jgi:hypothetical protein